MPSALGRTLGRAVLLIACLFLLMAGLGLLLTKVLDSSWPVTAEDEVNASLEAGRTATGNDLTYAAGWLGATAVVVGTLLVLMIVFRVVFKRWRESAFLLLAVSGQAIVFLFVTLAIDRERPDVERLDDSPPTSSFPSGHTGAAVALWLGIAVVIAWHTRHIWARALIVALLLLVPIAVAYARLYRGMHFPTDIVGSFINGTLAVLISARTILLAHLPPRLAAFLDRTGHGQPAAVVPEASRA
jgi:membrane-associated phospholipid phosphatase